MKTIQSMLLVLTLILSLSAYAGAQPPATIKILSPTDHSEIDAGESYPLSYEVALEAGSDHFHVWVDDKRGPGIHETKGAYKLPGMTPGEHTIMIKLVDKDHTPTGPKKSIKVIAK